MTKPFYTTRHRKRKLTLDELCGRFDSLVRLCLEKDYFQEKFGIDPTQVVRRVTKVAVDTSIIEIGFNPFAHTWNSQSAEGEIFDAIEFLYQNVSKPGDNERRVSESGFDYWTISGFDSEAAQREFRRSANAILVAYGSGFELKQSGEIEQLGSHGLELLLTAELIPFDEHNVDSKVRLALVKYRSRLAKNSDKQEAVRLMADVFEFLKKSQQLKAALNNSDESDLFNIANNFAVRHHNPQQKNGYDPAIWYAWMFHFYLATYHACVRLIIKKKREAVAVEALLPRESSK